MNIIYILWGILHVLGEFLRSIFIKFKFIFVDLLFDDIRIIKFLENEKDKLEDYIRRLKEFNFDESNIEKFDSVSIKKLSSVNKAIEIIRKRILTKVLVLFSIIIGIIAFIYYLISKWR